MAKVAAFGSLIRLMLLLFALNLSLVIAADNWPRLPALDTFSSYEDMQRYFDQRNFRSMRHINNPTDDSYLDAFNLHNEQPANPSELPHPRSKREERQLPSAPRMLRFELSDAVEPSMELKQLLRQHQERALKTSSSVQTPSSTAKPTAEGKKSRKPRRSRRSTTKINQQPANFKVQMIPFEVTDAREPDAVTAQLIKHGRALDTQREPQLSRSSKRKIKRSKRSAPPQFVKFELADAKTSLPAGLQRSGKQMAPAPAPSLLTMETQGGSGTNQTQETRMADNLVTSGESAAESKRMYVYKEAPGSTKTKKSLSALPHEVQKVITQLIKDGNGGKAYIKYLPAQKTDYEHYKAKPISYSPHKPQAYIKYVAAKSLEPVQVHIQPVPVVEQLRYVYKPTYAKVYPATPTITQPIVVQEAPAPAPAPVALPEEVHHTYSAELAAPEVATAELPPPPQPQATHFVVPQFRPSKPDPLQAELLQSQPIYGQYKYELQADPSASVAPLIKIEYHAPQDSINEHYKQLPEFRELSTLIGKSPDDQIHGLTYLLAKEMQSKLQRQPKQLQDRPQDSTAPILFHPMQPQQPAPTPALIKLEHSSLGVQPGRLIGMAKTKQYVPIVEPGNNDVKELPVIASSAATKLPTPSSFIDFLPGHGLSQGYEGVHDEQPLTTVEHIVQHPVQQSHHQGLQATSLPAELESDKSANGLQFVHNHEDKALQQYASKYAFGYRIRDFHTGNDFGHKQNRDLHGVTRGQYHILLPDGRVQNVIYHADDTGFHADVSFESGTSRH